MIKYNVRTTPTNLQEIIGNAPLKARGDMTEAAAVVLVGDERKGLQHYPPKKYVTRKRAYGFFAFTDRQRRFLWAKIKSGEIVPGQYKQTKRLQRGWYVLKQGAKTQVRNLEYYSQFVQGDKEQSRHEKLAGWRTVSVVASDMEKSMGAAAEKAMQEYLDKRGVGK